MKANHHRLPLLPLVFSLTLISAPGFGQQPLKSIQGFVLSGGEALNGVRVSPKNFRAPAQYSRDGAFVFRGDFTPGKTYLFSLEKTGYHPVPEIGLHPGEEGYLGTVNMEKIPEEPKDTAAAHTPFPENDGAFRILLFPFDPYSTCKNTDKYCLENIRNRFFRMNEGSALNIAVKTDERFNVDFPMSYDSARAIGTWYNADMVVWGDYEQQCNWDSSLFNVKFITLGSREQNLFKGLQGESKQRIGSFRSIVEEGALTGDIEDVVIWSMGVRHLQQGEYDAAIGFFKKIDTRPKPEYATVHCLIGWCHTLGGRYEEAIAAYDEALRLNSRNPLTYICRGILFQQKNEAEKALRDFERAKFLDGSSVEAHLQLSILQRQIGNAREAERNLQSALELDSLERENVVLAFRQNKVFGAAAEDKLKGGVYFEKGNLYATTGKYREAILFYKKSVSIKPDYHASWYNLGIVYVNLNQNEQAIECFKKSVSIKPDFHLGWHNLGVGYGNLSQNEQAIECFKKSIGIKPDFHEAWYNLGVVYEKTGQNEEAIECFKKSISIKPDYYLAWNDLGGVYVKIDQNEQAIECVKKVINIKPDDHLAWYNLGVVYKKIGNNGQEIECYKKAISFKPDYHEAWYNLGSTYDDLGQNEQAIECYKKAISIKPDFYQVWYNLGLIYNTLDQKNQAVECFKKSLSIKPDDPGTWNNLGVVYSNLGQNEQAIECYKKGIIITPNDEKILNNLGLTYSDLGQTEQAIDCFDKIIGFKPDDAYAFNNRANAYRKNGDLPKAKADVQQSLRLDSENGWVYATLAMIHADEGDDEGFYKNMEIAITKPLAYPLKERLDKEPTLQKFKTEPRFQQLLAQSKE